MQVILFALDGASPDLMSKWIEEGSLPNLAKIYDSGMSGKLESTFPPLTGPAWSTFQTGVNPGKHGVYNWLDVSKSYRGSVVNASSIKSKTIWEIISENGGKVGSLSVPVTFPPKKVNGFIIPGFLTPTEAENKGYPTKVAEELFKEVPEFQYLPEPYIRHKTPRGWLKELKKAVRARGKAARFLYDRHFDGKNNELFMTHFFATDLVQHFLWDEVTEDWDPRRQVFEAVDEEIGKIMELAPEDAIFLVISDHGFGKISRYFNINNWLHEEGYLSFKETPSTRVKRSLNSINITQRKLKPIGEYIYPIAKNLKLIDNTITNLPTNYYLNRMFLSQVDVDWEKTVAYSRSDIGHVRLNLKGREPHGILDSGSKKYQKIRNEIMDKLKFVEDPKNGQKIAKWVKSREELYSGPYLDSAPDILFNPLEQETCGYGAVMFLSSDVFSQRMHPGHHRRNGILFASGNRIERGKADAKLVDIAPTILNLFSFPIPDNFDGRVIEEISSGEPQFAKATKYREEKQELQENNQGKERLQSLGYL